MVTFVAVPYQLYALTGSPLQVGLLSLCDAVPLLLFSAVGGTIADRLDRRKLVLRAEVGLMVVSALLAANAFAPTPQIWALYVLAAVATSLWAIGAPALRALMPGLVPPEQLAASQALQGIYANTGAIVGPAVGGLLIAATGVGATYAIDTITFVPSLAAALLIAPAPPREPVAERALESLREGWRFLVRQRVILGTFLLDTNAMVFGMPQALFPAVAIAHFDGARVRSVCCTRHRPPERSSLRSRPAGWDVFAARPLRSRRRSSSGGWRSRASVSRPRSGSAWRCWPSRA